MGCPCLPEFCLGNSISRYRKIEYCLHKGQRHTFIYALFLLKKIIDFSHSTELPLGKIVQQYKSVFGASYPPCQPISPHLTFPLFNPSKLSYCFRSLHSRRKSSDKPIYKFLVTKKKLNIQKVTKVYMYFKRQLNGQQLNAF